MDHDTNGVISWTIDRRPWIDSVFDFDPGKAGDYNNAIIFIHQPVKFVEDTYECCICMENRENKDICALNCNHTCCATCVNSLLKGPRTFCCPFCRGTVTSIMSCSSKL